MNTVESDQLTSLDNVFLFLKNETQRIGLPTWASLSVQHVETATCKVSIYGSEPAPSYKWIHAAGATVDEAYAVFHGITNKTAVAAKMREEAKKLLDEAAAIEAS
jgi:hypothetical protein